MSSAIPPSDSGLPAVSQRPGQEPGRGAGVLSADLAGGSETAAAGGLASSLAAAEPAGHAAVDGEFGTALQLDRLGNHLAMAGLRLARLRARLESTEDRLMLIQARYDLDEAIAEVRRLALSARQREGN
jgi:hypothetical protein